MAKAVFVTYLIALSIGSVSAYAKECAGGPEYWCKSLENAQDCGAVRHCTGTVWSNDEKYAIVDSSTTCVWCQRILENTRKGIEQLSDDNKDMIVSTLVSACKLLPSNDLSSKCLNLMENDGTSVAVLLKNERYATLCRLMSVCSKNLITEKPPVIVGSSRCTWGPSYWCSSLSNSRECAATDHCSYKIWSQQSIEKKSNDNFCQFCESIIGELRSIIQNNKTEINVEKWLSDACSMLLTEETMNACVQRTSRYAEEILVLIKNNIDAGVICHLGQMCKEATIITRVKIDGDQKEEKKNIVTDNEKLKKVSTIDEQSEMLCNVIVRATHDLHVNQHKSQSEIQTFLIDDCQQLTTSELVQKCEDLVDRHSNDIYGHVASNIELSKICDYIDDFADQTNLQSFPHVHCELCTFVVSTAKYMLDAKQTEDKVLLYIDEQLCSRLNGAIKKNCKDMIETNGKDLIKNIQRGTQSMLLCTSFQVCLDEFTDGASPIQEDEMRSFLRENICDNLGIFKEACIAVMETNTTRFLKTLVNDMEGDILCQMLGLCPKKMSFSDNLSINDDTNKCKRCVDYFIRRKHIAEKLVNHSSEFLHHLCGQLPQKDECTKVVDESINKLVEYIQSLNPQDICVELKVCNATLLEKIEPIRITSSDDIINKEIIAYVKNEICVKLGPYSKLCDQIMNNEAPALFAQITKYIDPHQVCKVIDICPGTNAFDNCNDKCECCMAKIEIHEVHLATFLQTMTTTINALCHRMPNSENCRGMATGFKSNVNQITSGFNAKRVCQLLNHCSTIHEECKIDGDKCSCCKNQISSRQNNFRQTLNEITANLLSFCSDDDCRSNIQSTQQQTLNRVNQINSLTLCQRSGFCSSTPSPRSIAFLSHLLMKAHHSTGLLNQALEIGLTNNLCSEFGELKPICEHLLASSQSDRYTKVYMALLKNNPKLIVNDLYKQTTDTCDGCKNAVQSSKDFSIQTAESVRDILLRTCEHCPSKDQCQNYYNERYNNIKSCLDKINPEQVCRTIHLCSISSNDKCSVCVERLQLKKDVVMQAIDRVTGYSNDLCQRFAGKQCQIVVKQIQDSIQQSIQDFDAKQTCTSIGFFSMNGTPNEMDFDKYEKQLEDDIEKTICPTLGPFETLCKQIVHGSTKQIQTLKLNYNINDLMNLGEEVTENLGPCSDDKCQCCINHINKKKECAKTLGDKVISSFIRSCDYCPVKDQCRKYWQDTQTRFDSCIDDIDSKQVCIRFGYCNATSSSLCDNMDAFQDECKQMIDTDKSNIEEINNSNSTCILCEYVMNILSTYIHHQSTEEEIEQSLQNICKQVPSVLQNQCHELISNYGPPIIATLLREFDLSTICRKLNLCTSQMKIDITHLIEANTATCGVCDYVSTYIHFALQRDSSEKSLQQALSTVCTHLSIEHNAKCQTIVYLFSPHIRQLELSPGNNFCKQLKLCQTPMSELKPAVKIVHHLSTQKSSTVEKVNLTPKCTLCHYVISYLDAILKNNKSEKAFEEALEKVCTILPSKERTECDQFVKTYGPVLAQLIAEMADPDAICRYLGMCEAASTKKSTTVTDQGRLQTPYTCTICQFVVSRMKHFVGLNEQETTVLASLKESCDLFSVDSLKQQCKDFLNQHGSYFSGIVSNDVEPKIACQNIGICDKTYPLSTSTTSIPVSSTKTYGKCIFGMNYWCTSRENAELCNAVELCTHLVWSNTKTVI